MAKKKRSAYDDLQESLGLAKYTDKQLNQLNLESAKANARKNTYKSSNAIAPINNTQDTARKILTPGVAPIKLNTSGGLSEYQEAQKKQEESIKATKKAEELRKQVAKEKMEQGILSQTQMFEQSFSDQFQNKMSDKIKLPTQKSETSLLNKKPGETNIQAIIRANKENAKKESLYNKTSDKYKLLKQNEKIAKENKLKLFKDYNDNDDKMQTEILKQVMPQYEGMSKKQLLKEAEKLDKQYMKARKGDKRKRDWWYKNYSTAENIGNVLYKIFKEEDPTANSDEMNEILARQVAVEKAKQNVNLKNKKFDKSISGKAEKLSLSMASGFEKGTKGIETSVKKILGAETKEDRKFAREQIKALSGNQSYIQQLSNKAINETQSKFGRAVLEIGQSTGQMMPQMFVPGSKLSTIIGFANYGGSSYNDAINDGYTEEQATKYGVVNGALEMALNKVLPSFKINGKNIYGKTVSDKLSSKIMSKVVGNSAIKSAIMDATGEFTEEYLQEFLDPIVRETLLEENNGAGIKNAKDLNDAVKGISKYTAKNFFSKENLRAGILGFTTSGMLGATNTYNSYKYEKQTGRNAETNLTQNEQAVVDNIVENRKQQLKEQNGKVTKKEISKIEQEVKQDLQRGYIDTNDIERALSNEAWTRNNEVVTQKENLEKQLKELQSKKMSDMTVEEYNSTNNKISNLQQQIDNIDTDITRNELNSSMNGKITDNDTLLQRVYGEEFEKQNDYKFDEKEEQTKFNKTINDDIKNLKLNNHIKTRDTVDLLKKLSNETGKQYRLIDNNDPRVNKFEGKTINGFVENGEVFVNIDSDNLINRILGHETTHLFEGTEEHSKLRDIAKTYAETKGEYESRRKALQETYKDVKDADIENELTADIVGDYIFSDIDFVRNLSTEQPNMFQKIYNRVKHLYNMATAGSKEARQLEQLKYNFEKVYRENNQSKTTSGIKLSASKLELSIENNTNIEYNKDGNLDKYKSGTLFTQMMSKSKSGVEENVIVNDVKNTYIVSKNADNEYDIKLRIDNIEYNKHKKYYKEVLDYVKGRKETFNNVISNENGFRSDNSYNDDVKREETWIEFADTILEQYERNGYTTNNEESDGNNRELKSSFSSETKYSISDKDSNGRTLSKQQQEYFKNSKVVDDKGNLEIVYHQTNADFTEFKNGFSKRGFKNANFFTNQKPNKVLKNLMEGYVAINKPLYLENVSINQSIVDKAIQDGYDGIINQNIQGIEGKKEIVTFESKQFKNTNNVSPTSNPDIRYSISEKTGKLQDSKGNNVKLETSETGTTGSLMAIHNLSSDKLKGILELGGFPVPSIAITNPAKVNHNSFGEITVLFDKKTIDPSNRKNEVYDRDVWSPAFPLVENELNKENIENVADKIGIRDYYLEDYAERSSNIEDLIYKVAREDDVLEKYLNDNNIEYDKTLSRRDIRDIAFDNGIKEYLNNELKDIYGKKGIYNGKEYITSSGKRRTFWQLHEEYNLKNIVKIMTKKSTVNGQENNIFTGGFGNIQANMSKKFTSIKDIKNAENRLSKTADTDIESLQDNLQKSISELSDYYNGGYTSNPFTIFSKVSEDIVDFAGKSEQSESSLKNMLEEYGYKKVPNEILKNVVDSVNALKNIPTDYFEAKPQRAVGFDEVQQIIIPNNIDTELKQQLTDAGIQYTEYDPSIEGDRQRVINQFDELKFSLSNKNDIAPIKKNNKEVFGKEMRKQQDKAVKEAIAPLKEEVKALKKEVAELKEETTYNDLDNFDGDLADYVPVDATVFHGEQISDLRNFTKNKYLGWGEKAGIKDKLAKVRNELNFNDSLTSEQRKQLNTEEAQLSFALNYPNYRERLAKYESHQKKQIAPIDKAKENPKEYMPYLEMSKEINPDETNSEVVNLLNEVDSKNNNSEVKTKPRKQGKLSNAKRKAQYLFTNRNAEIDEYARETGNKNIKLLADHINNIQGEITTNINEVQTDNFGNAIGKGIAQIYDQARAENLSEAFDDYLFNKSNMARHLQGKGSVVDYNESEQLVKAYEETYPQMKEWANEVNNYNTNLLYKQADAGLITHELADNLTKMYDFYVPFMENIDSEFTPNETGHIKTRSTVKSARGGSNKNLLGFEEAMMRQTQSAITQIRKNQLYQEIVNTKNNSSMDFETNTNPNIEGGVQESGGKYYLTAYIDGKAVQTEIDKNLHHGLEQRLDKELKQFERDFSIITKPLQVASNIRRNILTTWSPTFLITNPLKDLQDAPLNSKYAKDMAKNVPRAFKEMATGKGAELDAFLNMYGKGNLRGDYNIDSGLADVTKLAKTNKKANTDTDNGALQISKNMLKKIPQLNEIIEMAPRYAEYLASIENGCSQMEALYNAREVTTNFGRGGIITKALNRNGFTFMNASVQGFSKLVRNFSGENGTKAVLQCVAKASAFGLAPALINAMLLGDDDDYEAIPDYIKDNYYLFKTSDNNFIRIPKGRMMSIFGSAGRRALERANGKRDELSLKEDISSYFSNAYNQVGVQNPSESIIFAPIIQAKNNKTWYGTDLVPKRLQTDKDGNKIPAKDQYDASTDKMSIWLGKVTGISPYKINYVVDQYSGGIGDMILPTITEEAQSKSNSVVGKALAPLKDKFTADSITDNKNVTNFYSKVESLGAKKNETGSKKDEMSYQYMRNLSFEMGSLYKEMREVQADKTLSNSKKYAKVQNIKAEINKIAEEGMRGYKDVESYENYARVGNRELYKYKSKNGKTGWSLSDSKYADDINTLGLSVKEKNDYYTIKMKMSDTASKYGEGDGSQRFRAVLKTIRKANLPSDAKYELYNSWYGKNNKISKIAQDVGIDADTYLDYQTADLSADKNRKGYSIRGSKANKVIRYLNKTNLDYGQKAILYRASFGYKGSYGSSSYSNAYNNTIINYLNTLDTTYEEDVDICKKLGFKVSKNGDIRW